MNVVERWIEFLNPFGIDATLFAFAWVLGTAISLILLAWMLSRVNFRSPAEFMLVVATIMPQELVWAPYAGFCMMLICAVVVLTIIGAGAVWLLAQVFGTPESEITFYPVIR